MNLAKHIDNNIFHVVAETCSTSGVKAFVIGGYVRDLLLKRPSKDVDIVVLGSGIKVARAVASRLHGTPAVRYFKNLVLP